MGEHLRIPGRPSYKRVLRVHAGHWVGLVWSGKRLLGGNEILQRTRNGSTAGSDVVHVFLGPFRLFYLIVSLERPG
jgi:hypothetical protein